MTDVRAVTVPKSAVFIIIPIGSLLLTIQFFRIAWSSSILLILGQGGNPWNGGWSLALLFAGWCFSSHQPAYCFCFPRCQYGWGLFFPGGIPGLIGTVTGAFTSITTFTLLPVPFFILMGELIFHSGLGLNAVNVLDKWLGNLRGRLSILAIIMGVIIGALSGSTIATCALLGTILLPDMLKKGYSKNMSLGPLMGVGTVDALIPPNALTVVLASLANIDVGQLLIAGICAGHHYVWPLPRLRNRVVSHFP